MPVSSATPLFQNGVLADVVARVDGKDRRLWGRGGRAAEEALTRDALRTPGLPVFLGAGLGAGLDLALAQDRVPLAVVDRERAILKVSGCVERLAGRPEILWLDQADPRDVLARLRRWQEEHGHAALAPVAPPFYQRLDRAYYGALRQALSEPAPAAGDFFQRMAYARFSGPLPRVLVLGSRYFIMGEVLEALTRLGAPFRLLNLHTPRDGAAYCADLLTAVADFRPDLILTVNHLGFDRSGALAELLERLRLPAVSWFVDNPGLTLVLFENARSPWVLLCAHDADDAARLRAEGFPHVLHLPLATDPHIFHPQVPGRPGWGFDVSFVGDSKTQLVAERLKTGRFPRPLLLAFREVARTFLETPDRDLRRHLEERHPETAALAEALPEVERRSWFRSLVLREASRLYRLRCVRELLPFAPAIAGDRHWLRALRGPAAWTWLRRLDYYEDLPALYMASKVNFNCTSAQMKGAPNQRVFDVPACGGFLLTDQRDQVAELFEPGREVVFYREPGEIGELVRHYLGNETARQRVAQAARARVLAEHTYEQRLTTLFAAARRIFA